MALILRTWYPADVHQVPGMYEAVRALFAAHGHDIEDVYRIELHGRKVGDTDWFLFLYFHRYAPRVDGQRPLNSDGTDYLTLPPVDIAIQPT